MLQLKALVPLLALPTLALNGCGRPPSYSDMSPDVQANLTENLEILAVVYENYCLETGESPANLAELERHIQDVGAELDLQVIRDCGYTINWGLSVEDVSGENAGQVVIAEAAGDSPKLFADGTVGSAGSP